VPVFHNGYRRYEGLFTHPRLRWWPIVRTGVVLALRGKLLRRLILVAHLPLLYFGLIFLAIGKLTDPNLDPDFGPWQSILHGVLGPVLTKLLQQDPGAVRTAVWSVVFSAFGSTLQMILVALTAAVVGPPLIARDVASRAFLLYFSRPVSFADYILGKAGVLCVTLAAVTLSPTLMLYVLSIVFSPSLETILHTLPVLVSAVLSGVIVIVPAAFVMLTLSSLVTQPRFAAAAWAVVCIFGMIFYRALVAAGDLGDAVWPRFLSLADTTRAAALWVYDVPGRLRRVPTLENLHTFDALFPPEGGLKSMLFLTGLCAICVLVLRRRVSAPTRV
jgi:ABC-2 type transport system permease protein